jgi:hypothetical protein
VSRSPEEVAYLRAVLGASAVAAAALADMERVAEQLAPERSAALAAEVDARCTQSLDAARDALVAVPAPAELAKFDAIFASAFQHAVECVKLFTGFPHAPGPQAHPADSHRPAPSRAGAGALLRDPPAAPAVPRLLVGRHRGTRRRRARTARPRRRGRPSRRVRAVRARAIRHSARLAADRRPPRRRRQRPRLLWTWVRDAKARGYLVVAPTAVRSTWSEVDEIGLLEILDWIRGRYAIATERVLLTGLSDGGTFTLVYGLAHPDRFRALAPLCGVFHPVNAANGNLARARGVPVYLVHGARDFLFPVDYARMTRDVLVEAGADLRYRELPELSHAYPRSENAAVLSWFEALGASG